jgi:uncharacterized protein YggE
VRRILSAFAAIAAVSAAQAQVAGGAGAQGMGRNTESEELARRNLARADLPPDPASSILQAAVLLNVRADEYVAVFGVSHEATTPAEALHSIDERIAAFRRALGRTEGFHIDFITQSRIYGFEVSGNVATERLSGFEVKKNVSVRYRDRERLDRLIAAAASAEIFDLVKVDYVVRDVQAVQARLRDEAARVLKAKADRYRTSLGVPLAEAPSAVVEAIGVYLPTELYSAYTAFEAESVSFRHEGVVQRMRKPRTFYFDPLSAKLFDHVLGEPQEEPVVQFTIYLRAKYPRAGT